MPYASAKECGRGGCHRIVPHGTRYCEEHTKQKNKTDHELYRKNDVGQKLYKTKAWENTRLYHLHEHPFCVDCLALGIENATDLHVDHIIPLKDYEGDPLDPTNLQTLCRSCHTKKSLKER